MKNGNVYYADRFKRTKQKTANWCFAAASKIVRGYFLDEKVSQADVVREYQKSRGEQGLDAMDKKDIQANYPGGGEEQWGILKPESSFVYDGAGDDAEKAARAMLKRNLEADVIVPAGYGGHCIVITHYDAEEDLIKYWDPLLGKDVDWLPLQILFTGMVELRDFYAYRELLG